MSQTHTGTDNNEYTAQDSHTFNETHTGTDLFQTTHTGTLGKSGTQGGTIGNQGTQTGTIGNQGTDTGTIGNQGTETGTVGVSESIRAVGNIGVTTTQQMIEQERNVVQFNVMDYIINEYKNQFCIQIY